MHMLRVNLWSVAALHIFTYYIFHLCNVATEIKVILPLLLLKHVRIWAKGHGGKVFGTVASQQEVSGCNPTSLCGVCMFSSGFSGVLSQSKDMQIKLVDPSPSHTPLSYCYYVCQAVGACTELTLSLTALLREILTHFEKNKKAVSDRSL